MQWDTTPHRTVGALAGVVALAGAGAACIPEAATLAAADASLESSSDVGVSDAGQGTDVTADFEAGSPCPGPCPTVIAEELDQPWGIAVDSANVYWTDHTKSKVYSCPRAGCAGSPAAIATNESGASGIAQRAGKLTWTNAHAGVLRTCDPNGCDAQTLAEGQSEPDQVSLTKDWILWSNLGGGQIMAMFQSWPGLPMEVSTGEFRPGTVDSSNDQIFWVVQGSSALASDGAIRHAAWTGKGFTQPATIVGALPGASGLALSSTHVFFTTLGAEKSSGRIYSFPIDLSGEVSVVATNQDEPFAIAFQGSTLYWLNRGDGTVMECEANACTSPKVIAADQTQPWSLAVDANGIFWTDRGARKVLMLPR